MRVALFFDGKNHMKDLRRAASERWIDHGALAKWVVEQVGGTRMVSAFYYTGVPNPNEDGGGTEKHALADLLEDLERKPGFFVRRINRRTNSRDCPHSRQTVTYTEEKMVDTSLVVDLVLLAARDAFDVAVVFSGDLDVQPALEALRSMGKPCWIATFGDGGLSKSLSRSAWHTIDLLPHLDAFAFPELETAPERWVPDAPEQLDQEMKRELRRAEAHFGAGGGFVGAHYFIHRWKGHAIPDGPEERRQSLQRLMATREVETYVMDGKTAVRTLTAQEAALDAVPGPELPAAPPPPPVEEEETLTRISPEIIRRARSSSSSS